MTTEPARLTAAEIDSLELAPGAGRQALQGWVPPLATEDDLRTAIALALDYRGDVTLTLRSGERLDAYVFSCAPAPALADCHLDCLPTSGSDRRRVRYGEIAEIAFSGKDCAAGRQWEDWVKKYQARKAAGEKGIALHPEPLD